MQTRNLPEIQLAKLNYLLEELWERNPFYTHKWCRAGVDFHQLHSLDELAQFPLTTRAELLDDQNSSPPLGANLTCPFYALKRIHRSSGTRRGPLFWADTPQSWAWIMRCSQCLYLLAGIRPADRVFFALPFGLSSGPWIMYEAACRLGCCCFTGGATLRTNLRAPTPLPDQLCYLKNFQPTVLVGNPFHLRSLAIGMEAAGLNSRFLGVEKLILTGESAPPDLRLQLEHWWDAECFDRYGLTEAGSVASECSAHSSGMHLLESEFVAEIIDPETTAPVSEGDPGELVLTTLGRFSRPIVRYRTGDMVRLVRDHRCPCGRPDALLAGGVYRRPFDASVPCDGSAATALSPCI